MDAGLVLATWMYLSNMKKTKSAINYGICFINPPARLILKYTKKVYTKRARGYFENAGEFLKFLPVYKW